MPPIGHPSSHAAGPGAIDLAWSGGRLSWPGGSARAACGRSGVRAGKREGDGATPAGTFPILFGLYRADRIARPAGRLAMTPLRPRHAWVDDPADANYNRLVSLPYRAHVERLWRKDGLYDLILVVGYNTSPVVAGAGSAIFVHVARAEFAGTGGCIAVARDTLVALAARLGPGSRITIARQAPSAGRRPSRPI